MKKVIVTDKAPQAIGPYSQAVQASGMLYISGQIPLDPATGAIVQGGISAQSYRVMDNLQAIVEAAGCTMADVLKTTVYLQDINDFAEVNSIYAKYFVDNYPARVCVEVSHLPKDALIEIDVIAVAK